MRPDDELTPLEQDALSRLPRSADPPADLEEATVAALAARGLVRRPRRRVTPVLAIAASLLLFAGGFAVGRAGSASPVEPDDSRPRFALFLYEGPEYRQPAPEAMEQRVQEYVAWASEGREGGSVEGGEKLKEDADRVIEPDGKFATVPAPAGEARLAGYFLIRAADASAALAIARTCPHVRYGGKIVVREIDET